MQRLDAGLCGLMVTLEPNRFLAPLLEECFLCRPSIAVVLALQRPLLQPPIQPLHLHLHLPQRGALVRALPFRQAPFFGFRIERPRQIRERPGQRSCTQLRLSQLALDLSKLLLRLADLAFQRQRPLNPGLAPGHRHVVKTFAGRREEKCGGIFERQRPCRLGIGSHITLAQLRQNRLQRPPKPIQHADAIPQRHNPLRLCVIRHPVGPFKRKPRLRVLRMDEESRPAIHARLQQPNPFVGRIPALDHDVVQLIAQELIDYALVLAVHFQEIRQGPHRGQSAAQRLRLEQLAHGVRRVAVFANQRFERLASTAQRRMLSAQLIRMPPRLLLLRALRLDLPTQRGDLRFHPPQRLGYRLKRQRNLPTLRAQRLKIAPRRLHLHAQALCLAL